MRLLKRVAEQFRRLLRFSSQQGRQQTGGQTLGEFQTRLGYCFSNQTLLIQSLTHKSSIGPGAGRDLSSNERLEFFGDAVLNCLVTEHIYGRYPTESEGVLSKIKSLLVSRKIVGEVAASIDLGAFLILGKSERKPGGLERTSIMSNAFEAVLGAIYLDGGLDQARSLLERLLWGRIDEFLTDQSNVNYKSSILEMAQADGFGIPSYTVLSTTGPEHAKKFRVGVEIAGVRMGQGSGSNKKDAEQNAAYDAVSNYDKESAKSRT